jgi:hypothetical protein
MYNLDKPNSDPSLTVDKIKYFCVGLPRVLQCKFRRLVDQKNGKERKRAEIRDDAAENLGQHTRRKKILIGVQREKFYPPGSPDLPELLAALRTVDVHDAGARESVYSDYRNGIQLIFVHAQTCFSCVPGFFDDPIHSRNHFEYLAGMSLQKNVEQDLDLQFDLVKRVVGVWCNTEATRKRMEVAATMCMEQQGSRIPEYVAVARELTLFWHKNLCGLFRYPSEEELSNPHILCREAAGSMRFDIHTNQQKIFQDLTLSSAISSFFHVIFISQLKYPPEGEAVAILLQRRLARVDEKGTIGET